MDGNGARAFMGHFLCDVDSDVVKTVTFETETWSKLRDRDFIRFPRLRLETFKFVHFAENFQKMSSSLVCFIFFKFLSFFRPVLVVSCLQIQQTKNR